MTIWFFGPLHRTPSQPLDALRAIGLLGAICEKLHLIQVSNYSSYPQWLAKSERKPNELCLTN